MAAELPVILHDRDVRPAAARAARMLWFAADALRGATLRGASLRVPACAVPACGRAWPAIRGAHRGGMAQGGAVKTARWLGVGAGLLTALAALLALGAFVVYEEIIAVTSLAGYLTYVLTDLAMLAVFRLRRLDRAFFWSCAGMAAAAAGGGAAHLAGHLGNA